MGTVTVSLPSDGSTADVGDYNTPITTLVNEFNGNIDNANIKTGAAIATSKIATDGGLSSSSAGAGFVVQTVSTNYSAVATGTTVIPWDDTIPQNTEGDEYMSISITPKSTTNILVIEVVASLASNGVKMIGGAIFQDSTAGALAATAVLEPVISANVALPLTHSMVAGTTSSTTFKFRAGGETAGTITFNGAGGARKFGGITASNIKITEYRP